MDSQSSIVHIVLADNKHIKLYNETTALDIFFLDKVTSQFHETEAPYLACGAYRSGLDPLQKGFRPLGALDGGLKDAVHIDVVCLDVSRTKVLRMGPAYHNTVGQLPVKLEVTRSWDS